MPQPVLLSDVGKVLIDFDFSIAARRLAERCDHPAETVLTLFDDIKGPYEDGRMDDVAFVREAIAATGFRGTAQEFEAIWCEIFTQNEPMRATLGALAGKLPMHLLSNTSGLHKNYFLRTFAIFQHFQDGVYSYSAGCSKPGEAIFHQTIAKLDLDPVRTFYIDDLAANIETAARLGFRTFHYSFAKHPQLQAELDEWLAAQGIG
ncbi:HAD-IA family hydrolase [Prosthecobacter sp.]|uniref:HAD-IA family hydrolase n=1 Tax=Prosthecobacter sp. TaxID=1965333 RepID=UPI002AB95E2E|nr:HAD-IA family hydrolase [Prosthecobacter sp.]MDZ4404383.1 HAD-IA family hydrolase [Prosthecobacter sp.]